MGRVGRCGEYQLLYQSLLEIQGIDVKRRAFFSNPIDITLNGQPATIVGPFKTITVTNDNKIIKRDLSSSGGPLLTFPQTEIECGDHVETMIESLPQPLFSDSTWKPVNSSGGYGLYFNATAMLLESDLIGFYLVQFGANYYWIPNTTSLNNMKPYPGSVQEE